MAEVTQKLHLTQDALGVDEIFERLWDLLDGDLLAGRLVDGRADNTIRTTAKGLDLRRSEEHDQFKA